MKSRICSLLLFSLAAVGLVSGGLLVTISTPANRAVAAEPDDTGPKPTVKSSVRIAIEKSLDHSTPPAITRLVGTVSQAADGGGVRYNSFTRRAIAEAVENGNVPGVLTPLPKFTPAKPGDFTNALTDDHVRKILASKLKSLTHAVAPPNLAAQMKKQNASVSSRPRARSLRARSGVSQAPQQLPSQPRLDWRDSGLIVQNSGIVTAVKDQGTCGCCWAFVTIAALEAAYARDNLTLINASEQYVLNNARLLPDAVQPSTCGGGWWAFDLLMAGTTPGGLAPGVPTENALPYTASDTDATPGGLALPYQLQSWGYVDTSDPNGIPSDDELKAALCDKGPLAVAVYVPTDDSGSAAYAWAMNHGDPIQDVPNASSPDITHVVLLVGWNDAVVAQDGTKGAWIIKNSWGEWGIPLKGTDTGSGFGYVSYGFNKIGTGAAWVSPVPGN